MRFDKFFTLIYLLICVNEIWAGMYVDVWPEWHHLSKPLIMMSLGAYFVWQTRQVAHQFKWFIITAFVFSWLGDSFLMYQKLDDIYFLLGLASFLIAHVFYMFAFKIWFEENHETPLLKRHPWMGMLLFVYAIAMYKMLEPDLGTMKLPVVLYIGVILGMTLLALNRFRKVAAPSFRWIFLGALAFLASDSILAYNKFVEDVDYSGILIMSTYCFAQFAIMKGALCQLRTSG
jgi:uncharacterized membrane protein YhhN